MVKTENCVEANALLHLDGLLLLFLFACNFTQEIYIPERLFLASFFHVFFLRIF